MKTKYKFSLVTCTNATVCAIIIVACISLYFHSLFYGFTGHDDDVMVTNNLEFLNNLSNLRKVFITDAWYGHKWIELYRPIQSMTFILDAQWGTNLARTMHISNLILHISCCIIIYFLLCKLHFRRKIAILGALVYSTHFLFLHSVIWIPARGDMLLSFFALISIITFICAINNGSWYHYLLHMLFFLLAIFSKETAIILPFIYLLYVLLFAKFSLIKRQSAFLLLYYFIVATIYFYLRNASVSENKNSIGIMALIKNLPTIPETIAKFFFPVNFSTMPSFQFSATAFGTLIILGFLLLFLVQKRQFNNITIFALSWFLLFMLPGMAYRPEFASYTYDYLDHRSYLVCIGLLLIMMNILQLVEADTKKNYWIFSIILIFYLASANCYLSISYRNPLAYAESAIKTNPKSALAYFFRGNEKTKLGAFSEALKDYSQSITLHPDLSGTKYNRVVYSGSLYNRAVIFYKMNLYKDALNDLDNLTKLESDYGSKAYNLKGIIKATQNDYVGACQDFNSAVRLNPGNHEASKNLKMLKEMVEEN